MAPTTGRPPKTVEDYLALPDDVRAELIGGDLYVTTSPTPRHQAVVGALYLALAPHVERQGLGRLFLAPLDVHLPTGDVVQPDLLFVSTANLDIVQDRIRGTPDLVVEVVSTEHAERDRIVKHDLYARAGVPEYWILEPSSRTVEVFRLEGRAYRAAGYHGASDVVGSPRLGSLAIDVGPLFRFA